jgi:hypothetical protein
MGAAPAAARLIEAAPHVRPAEGQFDVTAPGRHTIAGISVDLQDSLEAG